MIELINHTIQYCMLSQDKMTLTFITKTKKLVYQAVGDCCSVSWIEHWDMIPQNSLVTEIIEKDVTVIQEVSFRDGESFEQIQQYFYEIVTDKGSYTIEMRNESNGYYGGSINLVSQDDITHTCEHSGITFPTSN